MNTNATDQHRTSEPSLEEMTHIMNSEDGNGKTPDQPDNENNIIDVVPIEDFTPEKNATKVSFRKNGMAKGTLVGAVGLVALAGGLTFFQGQMPKDKVAEAPKPKDPASEQVEAAQSDATKAQQSESETKSELALSKQRDALEQANSNKANDPATGTPTDKATDKTTDPNTKVAAASSVPITPPAKPSRAIGFVAPSIVPPLAIPPSGKVVSAPFVPPSKNNISIPPAGIQPLPAISAPKLATTPIRALISKNTSPAPVGIALPLTAAPGLSKATKPAETAKIEPARSAPIAIAKIEPTRSSPAKTLRKQFSEDNEEPLTRLRVARAPGISTEIASSNLPALPLYPPVVSQPSTNSIPPVAINSAPSLTDFLRTSSAADTQPQLIALNKEQSKDKQLVTSKDPKSILQIVPTPVGLTATKSRLIASSNLNGNKDKYSRLISPNSLLTDIVDPAPFGITNLVASAGNVATQIAAKPALAQAVPPGTSSTRPAYAHTKMLLAGLPDTNINLGNVETANQQNTTQNSQVNKSQVVSQNNSLLNQPASSTVPGTPINPVSPTTPAPTVVGPIAASILTGTSAKGTTLTPILWGSDSANGAKFVAKLEEPLLANNKQEALPTGTQLIVMAKPSSSSSNSNNNSLVEIDVVGVIVQGREYATPPGAIVIHDENNGLLVGEDYFKREDQIASRDYLAVLSGALGTLGQVLNRPSGSFSSNSSGFGSSSTNIINNRDPNIFGALLEGGFKDIPGIWNQRNQQALAQLANQPKVYQIPKGRIIRVFVNQSINF